MAQLDEVRDKRKVREAMSKFRAYSFWVVVVLSFVAFIFAIVWLASLIK